MTDTTDNVPRELLYRISNVYAAGLTMDEEVAELRALLAQPASVPDEVRRDAQRLDWLEKMAADDWGLMLHNGSVRGDGMRGLGLLGRDLRSAIDTAMRGNPQA